MAEPNTPQDKIFIEREQWHFPRGLDLYGETTVNGEISSLARDDLITFPVGAGISASPRIGVVNNSVGLVSQLLNLVYFRPHRSFTASILKFYTAGVAAGATPTLVKYALFTVAGNGDLTRVGITPNDTALLAATFTPYPKAMTAPVGLIAQDSYAIGILIVTAAALPSVAAGAGNAASATIYGQAPRMTGQIAGQADIAAAYPIASIADMQNKMYAEVLP